MWCKHEFNKSITRKLSIRACNAILPEPNLPWHFSLAHDLEPAIRRVLPKASLYHSRRFVDTAAWKLLLVFLLTIYLCSVRSISLTIAKWCRYSNVCGSVIYIVWWEGQRRIGECSGRRAARRRRHRRGSAVRNCSYGRSMGRILLLS